MSGYERLVRDLQRHIRDHPRLTRLPVCPGCDLQRAPADFTVDGICRQCEADRAQMYADAMRPDGTPMMPPPRDPIQDDGFDFEDDDHV